MVSRQTDMTMVDSLPRDRERSDARLTCEARSGWWILPIVALGLVMNVSIIWWIVSLVT